MEKLPVYISIIFSFTTLLTVLIFYKASNNSKKVLIGLYTWLAVQAVIGLSGFYTNTTSIPPRFLFLLFPPLLLIIGVFFSVRGRNFIDRLDVKLLTILHIVRLPVEIVLYWLFINKAVPQLMTFEGRNFDMLSGLTAPFIYYFGYINKRLSNNTIILWNLFCLGLLFNIAINAVLSAPFPFQKFAFDQPNIAVLYFPYNWLPACIVPLVLFSHLVCIRQLMYKSK